MTGIMENESGRISIDADVISKFAGHAALDCFGIVGMASVSMKDGLVKLLKRDSVGHGVCVRMGEDGIDIDFHIIIAYGVNIKTIVTNLRSTVKYQVEDYTTIKVNTINVFVEGVRVID